MEDSLLAPNFQWPMPSGPHPVILQLRRDPRTAQLVVLAMCNDEGYLEPFANISIIPHDGVTMFLCNGADEFYAKNYSENEGVVTALVAQGLVVDLGAPVRPYGSFVEFPRVRLTDKAKALAPAQFAVRS